MPTHTYYNMKLSINLKSIPKYLLNRISIIVYIVIILVICWLIYFTYINLYQVSLNPKEINEDEIFSRKEKVNLELFNTISKNLNNKKESISELTPETKNPFAL